MNDLVQQERIATLLPTASTGHAGALSSIMNPDYLLALERFAERIATSQLIPGHFRDKPGDIFIALHMAGSMGADWLQVLQNLYVVKGTPGWSAKFIIAQANISNAFKTSVRFRERVIPGVVEISYKINDNWRKVNVPNLAVTAYALGRDDKEVAFEVSMEMAQREGWTTNPKYHSLPQLMLSYRAGAFLVRLHAPQVMFGYSTQEEIEDMAYAGKLEHGSIIDGGAGGPISNDDITQALTAQAERARDPATIRDEIVTAIRASTSEAEIAAACERAAEHFSGQQLAGITKVANSQRGRMAAAANLPPGPTDGPPAAKDQPEHTFLPALEPGGIAGRIAGTHDVVRASEIPDPAGNAVAPPWTAAAELSRVDVDEDPIDDNQITIEWQDDTTDTAAMTGGMATMAKKARDDLMAEVGVAPGPAALAQLDNRARQILVGFPQHLSEVRTAIALRVRSYRQPGKV